MGWKRTIVAILAVIALSGCSKFDGVASIGGVINKYNPHTESREALKDYGKIRKEVRSIQDSKKVDANTSRVSSK